MSLPELHDTSSIMGREVRPLLLTRLWPLLLLLLLTFGEYRLFRSELHRNQDGLAFVLANVDGILAGKPVWQSSQHRVLGPLLVAALERVASSPAEALAWVMALGLVAQNGLLFRQLRRGQVKTPLALAAVATFGLLHWLTLYKLEYPWDWIDVPLFTAFGYWAATRGPPKWLLVFVLIGVVNHETVLYFPLWCALAAFDRDLTGEQKRREWWLAGATFALVFTCVFVLRRALYQGPAELPGYIPEVTTPWLQNPIHFHHNRIQLWRANWGAGRAWISLSVLGATLTCLMLLAWRRHARAAGWSLAVLFTIFCFGYVNETRLYLAPIAFWFGYASALLARPFRGIGHTRAACTNLPNLPRQTRLETSAPKRLSAYTYIFRIACRNARTATF